jgi:hypothetical protein
MQKTFHSAGQDEVASQPRLGTPVPIQWAWHSLFCLVTSKLTCNALFKPGFLDPHPCHCALKNKILRHQFDAERPAALSPGTVDHWNLTSVCCSAGQKGKLSNKGLFRSK